MNKFELAKKLVGYAAQIGAGKITYSIIKNNVTAESTTEHVTLAVGSYAIGGVVADKAKTHIYQVADEARDFVRALKKENTQPES